MWSVSSIGSKIEGGAKKKKKTQPAYNPCTVAMYVDAVVVGLDTREDHCSSEHAHADVDQGVRGASLLLLAAEQSLQLEFVLHVFEVDEQQHQACSRRGAIGPAAVFVLQMAWDAGPSLVRAGQCSPDTHDLANGCRL